MYEEVNLEWELTLGEAGIRWKLLLSSLEKENPEILVGKFKGNTGWGDMLFSFAFFSNLPVNFVPTFYVCQVNNMSKLFIKNNDQ